MTKTVTRKKNHGTVTRRSHYDHVTITVNFLKQAGHCNFSTYRTSPEMYIFYIKNIYELFNLRYAILKMVSFYQAVKIQYLVNYH